MVNDIRPGDLVRVKPEYTHINIMGVWIAEKMLTKNWELKRPATYKGPNAHKKLRAKPYQLENVTITNVETNVNSLSTQQQAQIKQFPIVGEGTIVLVQDPGGKIPDGLYVVTKSNITGNRARANIAEIGGGKMWRCPIRFMRVIPKGQFEIRQTA